MSHKDKSKSPKNKPYMSVIDNFKKPSPLMSKSLKVNNAYYPE